MNKVFFTSDTHFGHTNIIKYCDRPFSSTKEHDDTIINNWNSIVNKKDIVYHLGDLAFFKEKNESIDLMGKLHGVIFYIWGNHDKTLRKHLPHIQAKWQDKFTILGHYHELNHQGERIVLSHYSFRVWNKSHHGSWNLYGHSHGTLSDDPHARAIDVGIDCHSYYPIEFEQVKEIMDKKLWQPVDHHRTCEEANEEVMETTTYSDKGYLFCSST